MARKNILQPYNMFEDVDISTNQTSNITNVQRMDKASIFIEWSGSSPVGTMVLQAKNSEDGSWFEVDFGDTISISGNTGDHILILNEIPFYALRLSYTAGSGTGTLTGTIVAKQVGG